MSTSSDDFPGSFDDALQETPQALSAISSDSSVADVSAQYDSIKSKFQHLLGQANRLPGDDASTLDDMFLRMRLWESTIAGSTGSIPDFERQFPFEADTVRMQMENVILALEEMQISLENDEGTDEDEPDRPVTLLKAAIYDLVALSESLHTLIGLRNQSGAEARVKKAFLRRRDASLLKPVSSTLRPPDVTPVISNSLDPDLLAELGSPAPFARSSPRSAPRQTAEEDEADGTWGSLVALDPRYGTEPIILKRTAKEPSTAATQPKPKAFTVAMAADSASPRGARSSGYLIGRHPECDVVISEGIVSNRHCLLFMEETVAGTVAIVEDLSSNGTYVNEAIVGRNQRRELKDNDEISVHGRARFIFRYPDRRRNTGFLASYNLQEKLGKGHFAEVYACIEKATGHRYAAKVFNSHLNERELRRAVQQEGSILMSVSHPNILSIKDIFNERDKLYLVLELAPEGELFNHIIMRQKLSESESRSLFRQLFGAIKYLHDRNILHRDIKPENIFLMDKAVTVKIADFGLSKIVGEESFTTTLCGTPSYVAPEVLTESKNRRYTKAVDVWSLGVVLYICLCGFPPFSDELYTRDFPYTLSQQIRAGRFDYPSPYWDSVADPALDLVDSMLVVDPERRFTIDQCIAHPWMKQTAPEVNDSTSGLVGGIAGLEVRRAPARERTLLATLNMAQTVTGFAAPSGSKTPKKAPSQGGLASESTATGVLPGKRGDKRLFSFDDDDDDDDDSSLFRRDKKKGKSLRD